LLFALYLPSIILIGWWLTIGGSLCKWGLGTGPSLYWIWKQSWRKKSGTHLPLCQGRLSRVGGWASIRHAII